jgi:hypothetical protein
LYLSQDVVFWPEKNPSYGAQNHFPSLLGGFHGEKKFQAEKHQL